MDKEIIYQIYTDASFDNKTKVGTYAIVVIRQNEIEKIIAKKIRHRSEKLIRM